MGAGTILRDYTPAEVFAAADYAADEKVNINAEKTSKDLNANGADQMTVAAKYIDEGSGTATSIDIEVDGSWDGTDWATIQTASVSAGIVTLADATWRKATPATGTLWSINIPINLPLVRVRIIGPAATADQDRAEVRVRFSSLGA